MPSEVRYEYNGFHIVSCFVLSAIWMLRYLNFQLQLHFDGK